MTTNCYPYHMIIEVSSRCNLKCIMCASKEDPRIMPGGDRYGDLDIRVIDNLENALPHIRRVDLNGHGESLMNKQFLEIFSRVRGKVAEVGLTTNALMINDHVAKTLVTEGMDEIIISVHAAGSELYRSISPPGRIESLIEVLNLINGYKSSMGTARPFILFQFVGMRRNAHELIKIVELASKMKVRGVNVLSLAEYPLVKGESLERYPELMKKYFLPALKKANKLGVSLTLPENYQEIIKGKDRNLFKKIIQALRGLRNREIHRASLSSADDNSHEVVGNDNAIVRDCLDPWTFFYILQSGQVRLCCVIDQIMGNLLEQTFEDVWFGEKYQTIRKRILENDPPKECLSCLIRPTTTTLGALKARIRKLESPNTF